MKTSVNRKVLDYQEVQESEIPAEDGFYYAGYFKLDERLHPVKIEHPFKTTQDAEIFGIEGAKYLAEGQPPVK